MISFILLLTVQFCTSQIHPQHRTVPIVSDEHGNLFFGDPFEQNEAAQVQSPIDEPQLTDETLLSAELWHDLHVESPPVHILQPQIIRKPLIDEGSLSADLYHPVYTAMRSVEVHQRVEYSEAHQQEVCYTLSQEAVATDMDTKPIDKDLGTLLDCLNLGPLTHDEIYTEPLLMDMETEILKDTSQVRNEDTNVTCPGFGGSACEQSVTRIRTDSNLTPQQSEKNHFMKETGKIPFKCDMHQKELLEASVFRTCREKNQDKVPFQCDICPEQFVTFSRYQGHRRTHTGEKPFQCDFCQKRFSDSSNCRKHRRIHTGEKRFQCEACLKQFYTSSDLKTHRRIHTGEKPFQCEICPKQFYTSSDYQKHRRIHTGEKPYQCDICAKQFRVSSDYHRHRRTHTGEKPFKCDFCQKEFGVLSNYKKHRQIHTADTSAAGAVRTNAQNII